MSITVASFNIEKNGKSSELEKQSKVSYFIDTCVKNEFTVIFLCEVHSAQTGNYSTFLSQAYADYNVYESEGGYSNGYICMVRTDSGLKYYYDTLKYMNRKIVLLAGDGGFLTLAHFKSGQTGLTKDQLQTASASLEEIAKGKWAITGDMNWDFRNQAALTLPGGTQGVTCWGDDVPTQIKDGILDWCLAGKATLVEQYKNELFSELLDMSGPDHRPVSFKITY